MRFQHYIYEMADDTVDLRGQTIFKHAGVTLADTHHAVQRIQQRNELTMEELKRLFAEALDKFKKIKTYVGEKLVFYSKSLKQSFIAAVEGKNDLTLITFYPRKERPNAYTHPDNHDVVLEGVVCRLVEID
jgi:hypothetical protein